MPEQLILRPLFPMPPVREVVADFQNHVKATGEPETFYQVSTARPPAIGDLTVLWDRIEINSKRRPNGGMAPCPICRPSAGKWLHGGTLIWCQETSAIYCIGPQCTTGIEADRLTQAKNEYNRTERELENVRQLASHMSLAPARLAWIDQVLPIARNVDEKQAELRSKFRKLCDQLSDRMKRADILMADVETIADGKRTTNRVNIGAFKGVGFVRSTWREERRLQKAKQALIEIMDRCASMAPEEYANALAASECALELKKASSALSELKTSCAQIAEAEAFRSQKSVEMLCSWISKEMPFGEFKSNRTATNFSIIGEKAVWKCGIVSSSGIPELPMG